METEALEPERQACGHTDMIFFIRVLRNLR